ncbi:5342_t:CDS:2 [Funneliformis mosseae]|uniref:5342_t:CDS:1 n=1 Tax=Funneliformis mosseae TaxID=27381 RepID=A0A9N9E146_FUNMO|nr:5342_t:CDS:2 [Funneliformis mosseae]
MEIKDELKSKKIDKQGEIIKEFIKLITESDKSINQNKKSIDEFIKKMEINKNKNLVEDIKDAHKIVLSYFEDGNTAEIDDELAKDFLERLTK